MSKRVHCLVFSLTCCFATLPTGNLVAQEKLSVSRGRVYEARVNTFTTSDQENAALAILPDDSLAVVWESRRQEGGTYGINLQRFDSRGQRIGDEVPVNIFAENMQVRPAVIADPTGGFWTAWESFEQDGSMNAIIARRFGAGDPTGSDEILVNQITEGHQSGVGVAVDQQGNATFVWTTPRIESPGQRVVFRKFDPEGKPLCDEMPVYSGESAQQLPTIVACRMENEIRFVVAWAETGADGRPSGIRVRVFSDAMIPLSHTLSLATDQAAAGIEPAVAATPSGFAVGWLQRRDNDYEAVFQQFGLDGTPVHAPLIASPDNGHRVTGIAMAADQNGHLAVAWNRSTDGALRRESIVEAGFWDAAGAVVQPCFQFNRDSSRTHSLASISGKQRLAIDSKGRMIAVWNGHCDGDESGVGLTVLSEIEQAGYALSSPAETSDRPIAGADIARPHEPPKFNRRHIARDRFGGDRSPVSQFNAPFGFIGIVNTGWTPPDPVIAVGPDHIVEMTNGEIAIFDKLGTELFSALINGSAGFWGAQGATNFVFDPEVLYDPDSGRFFAMACERSSDTRSFYLLAVSDDSDPTGNWYKYRLDVTAISDNDIDSPNMAIDSEAVYLCADFFGPDKYLIYMLDKSQLIAGAASPTTRHILLTGQQSHGIAMNYDADSPATYLIRGDEFTTSTTLRLQAVLDPLGSPTLANTTITVPLYGHPVDPVSQGTSSRPELFESRFWSCVYRNGRLWAVHHQSPTTSSAARARWYEINMRGWPLSGSTPLLVQSGEIFPGSSTYTFFPSIWVDGDGNAAITFARSSSTEFISMCRSIRLSDDPPGTFRAPEFVRQSTAAYTGTRWGDYSGTMDDPAEPNVFWGVHEYTPGSNSWNTWIGKYELPIRFVLPFEAKFVDGSVTGGGIPDLGLSDDIYMEVNPGANPNPRKQKIGIVLEGTAASLNPSRLGIQLESKTIGGNPADVVQHVYLHNYTNGLLELIDSRPTTSADAKIIVNASGDLSRFINPGTSEIRAFVEWKSETFSGTPFLWSLDIDQLVWRFVD
jgi:hypothetical protein